MSTTAVIVIAAIFLVVNAAFIWFMFMRMGKKAAEVDPAKLAEQNQGMSLLLQHINDMRETLSKTIDSKIGETTRQVSESMKQQNESMRNQFGESAKLIRDVTMGLTARYFG